MAGSLVRPKYMPAGMGRGGYAIPAAGVHSRWDDMVVGWSMNESSDGSGAVARADLLGNDDLTDINTTPSGTGKNSNAADFNSANSERLEVDISPSTWIGEDKVWTFSTWIYIDSANQNHNAYMVFAYDSSGDPSWAIRIDTETPAVILWGWATNNGSRSATVTSTHGLSDTAWNHFVCRHYPSSSRVKIIVNDGTEVASSPLPANQRDTAKFSFGGHAGGTLHDGLIDESTLFDVTKDGTWITNMYNSGSGVFYPD